MFEEQTCGQCGVVFHPRAREIYVYKRNLGKRELLFCGYTCMRAFDREWERKKLKNREKLKTKKGGLKMKPQCQMLLDYMRLHGSVTGLQALSELGIMNYKGRIHDLRKLGYTIRTDYITRMNAHGEKKTFARYTLKGDDNGESK